MPGRKLLADIRPLRESAPYRRLWIGTTLSSVGSAMTTFAVALQVYRLTHSSAAVGGIGLATALPSLAFGLFGGAIVDAVDRRRLVLLTQSCLMALSAAFAAQAFAGNSRLWLLYVLVAAEALCASINAPARRTFMPRLVPKDQIAAGAALTMLAMHISVLAGPLLAGLIVPIGGVRTCYLIDVLTFVAAMYGVFRLPPMRPEGEPLLGMLGAGLAIGGVLGTVFSGPVARVRRKGLGVLVSGGVWGAALAGFGLVDGLVATMVFLVLAGVADVTSVVLRSTIIQVAAPDAYRGRINATEIMVGGSVPQIGNFRAGTIAEVTSPGVSAAAGGFAAIAGAVLVGLAFPALVRYRPEDPPVSAGPPGRR